jgi:hypothetical protein
MISAPLHFQAVRTCSVAIAAARTASAAVVNSQADSTQRTGALDYVADGRLRSTTHRLGHGDNVTFWSKHSAKLAVPADNHVADDGVSGTVGATKDDRRSQVDGQALELAFSLQRPPFVASGAGTRSVDWLPCRAGQVHQALG